MTTNVIPYKKYKDSGIKSAGDVPSHWSVRRLRDICTMRVSNVDKHSREGELPVRLCNYVDVYKYDRIRPDLNFMHATATRDEIERFQLQSGDVLITKDSEAWNDIGVPALVERSCADLVCGYHLALLRPSSKHLNSTYLYYALQAVSIQHQFHIAAKGVTRYGLSHNAIKSVCLPVPPIEEQAAIVRLLDHTDTQISRYICAKKRLIKLLKEWRQAIIDCVATGNPNDDIFRKESGIGWSGTLPQHWDRRRLRYLVREKLTYGANAAAEYTRKDWPRYLRITDFSTSGRLREDTFRSLPPHIASEYSVDCGDILLARSGSVGKAFMVDKECGPACHAGYLIRVRLNESIIDPEFFFTFTQSSAFHNWKNVTSITATIENISAEKYSDMIVPVPPLEQQRIMMDRLRESGRNIDRLVGNIQQEITLVHEYRTRLVLDVMTGKYDVRQIAP